MRVKGSLQEKEGETLVLIYVEGVIWIYIKGHNHGKDVNP